MLVNNADIMAAAKYGSTLAAFNTHKAESAEAVDTWWISHEDALKFSDLRHLDEGEAAFWRQLIKKYLAVDRIDLPDKQKLQASLDDMRDRGTFAFFMLNSLWIAFVFPILLAQDRYIQRREFIRFNFMHYRFI